MLFEELENRVLFSSFPPRVTEIPHLGEIQLTRRGTLIVKGLPGSQNITVISADSAMRASEFVLTNPLDPAHPSTSSFVACEYSTVRSFSLAVGPQEGEFTPDTDALGMELGMRQFTGDGACFVISADDGCNVVIPKNIVRRFNIDAGGGNDVVVLKNVRLPATVLGSAGDDTLLGSEQSDQIVGGSGDDVIGLYSQRKTHKKL